MSSASEQDSPDLLRAKLGQLSKDFEATGALAHQAAKRMSRAFEGPQTPPSESFSARVRRARKDFELLRDRIVCVAEQAGLSSEEHQTDTLDGLRALIDRLEAQPAVDPMEEPREAVRAVLRRVLALGAEREDDREALVPAHDQARAIWKQTNAAEDALPDPAQALIDGTHPLAFLLALRPSSGEDLGDGQLDEAEVAVEDAFGRSLRRAASRGRLAVRDEELQRLEEDVPEEDVPEDEAQEEKAPEADGDEQKVASKEKTEAKGEDDEQEEPNDEEPNDEEPNDEEPNDEEPIDEEATDEEPEEKDAPEVAAFEQMTASVAATMLMEAEPAHRAAHLPALVDRLVAEEEFGLAFHLACAVQAVGKHVSWRQSAAFVRAVALGPHLTRNDGALASLLQYDLSTLSDFSSSDDGANGDAPLLRHHLLLAAAALRPALLAPSTNASSVLDQLPLGGDLQPLHKLCTAVADYGKRGQPFNPSAGADYERWQQGYQELREEVQAWWKQAPTRRTQFAPATEVWQRFVQNDGLLVPLLRAVLNDDAGRATAVRAERERLSDVAEVRDEIEDLNRNVLDRRDAIEAGARDTLERRVENALELVQQWLNLCDERPPSEDWIAEQSRTLREKARPLLPDAQYALNTLLDDEDAVPREAMSSSEASKDEALHAAVQRCHRVLAGLEQLFDPEMAADRTEPAPQHLLHADLLHVPGLKLMEDWSSAPADEDDPDALIEALLGVAARPERSWEDAFDRQCEQRDHRATERIIEHIEHLREKQYAQQGAGASESSEEPPAALPDPARLRRRRDNELAACRDALERRIDEVESHLKNAGGSGLFGEEALGKRLAQVAGLHEALHRRLRFRPTLDQLDALDREIEGRREEQIQRVREYVASPDFAEQLEAAAGARAEDDYAEQVRERISEVLDAGDTLTAREYIDHVRRREALPKRTRPASLEAFFPKRCRVLGDLLDDPEQTVERLAENLARATRQDRPARIGPVEVPQPGQAEALLGAWAALKKKDLTEAHARRLLGGLGFEVREASIVHGRGRTYIEVQTETVRRRELCPVPGFGSQADGRYRVLCVWDHPTEEDLISAFDAVRGTERRAVLVFHFGRMAHRRRRALARRCAEGAGKSFAVLDDLLLLHLCGEESPRLPSFFACALPFAHTEPYRDKAGWVAPEMFYGRRKEKRRIQEARGSSLVYGGRQLGKTVLLKEAARSFRSAPAHVARYLDIERHDIGTRRTPDKLWRLLIGEMQELGVLPKDMRRNTGPAKIQAAVEDWLAEDPDRRILLLLDEADHFFSQDSQRNFGVCRDLKGFMEDTQGRFKVVFAGLHNVRRTTSMSNNPIAHLGDPVRVRPLLFDGEWKQAQALIEEPLRAMGYRFESAHLPTLIRSHTNSYPSLLQRYGQQLLEHLTQTRAGGLRAGDQPPYPVTREHLRTTYENRDLRASIRHKFELTIELDPRYALIAYVVALECIEERDCLETGRSVAWVRGEVMDWWKAGFRGSDSEEAIAALLEEMVDLGVLRSISPNSPEEQKSRRYTLRTPNVLRLLGSKAEVEGKIEDFATRGKPPEYDPRTFRSAFRFEDAELRAPLTVRQIDQLRGNGAAVVFGSPAAGLHHLHPFLQKDTEPYADAGAVETKEALLSAVDEAWEQRQPGRTLVVRVGRACPWTPAWVRAAHDWAARRQAPDTFVRVLFEAGPDQLWALTASEEVSDGSASDGSASALESLVEAGCVLMSLQPWHEAALLQWLQDANLSAQGREERVTDLTGHWPLLLQKLYQAADAGSTLHKRMERFEEFYRTSEGRARFADAFGTNDPARRGVLDVLAQLDDDEGVPEDVLTDLADAPSGDGHTDGRAEAHVARVLRWAERLNLVYPARGGRWHADPVLAHTLRRNGEPEDASNDESGGAAKQA